MRYVRSVDRIVGLTIRESEELARVASKYEFRANDYYLGLIDWEDPDDPIRCLVIPQEGELTEWGNLDASREADNRVIRGLQHKYADTALLLVNNVCGAYCRYCFRKRLFMNDNDETTYDLGPAFEYIARRPEITDVLLTGGDPLITSTAKLRVILETLAGIPHVRTIRIGTKMPAFNPFRILDDFELQGMIRDLASDRLAIYVMAHFDHPRELTAAAREGLACLLENHARAVNQCPIIAGVNDDAEVLAELFSEMTLAGAPQYYLFQGRPTAGNRPFEVPLLRAWRTFDEACSSLSGLSRRARFCMSHSTGKIEVVGLDDDHVYMRYHRARDPRDAGRFMAFRRNEEAYWLDDLEPVDLN